uniref:Uncharacterized protein n=1 Tax=Arundo donax TaxID=35708 RepID=A0A0A9AC99_ARUDO
MAYLYIHKDILSKLKV